jgi:hypothetical protein
MKFNMEKRALIGKIFLTILIIILIIITIAGITAYQAVSLLKLVQQETPQITSEVQLLASGDCSKISSIETRIDKIESEVTSACKNPLIKIAVEKMDQIPIKCNNIAQLKVNAQGNLTQVKELCNNKTLIK